MGDRVLRDVYGHPHREFRWQLGHEPSGEVPWRLHRGPTRPLVSDTLGSLVACTLTEYSICSNPNLWGDPGSAIISSLNSFPRTYGPPGNSNSGSSDTGSDGNDNGGGDNDSNNDTDNDIDIGGDDHGSGNTEGDSGYNSGGNSGASSEGDDAASSSSPSSTPTVSPTVCNRRKKRSLASLGRRHHRHHRQARRLTSGY